MIATDAGYVAKILVGTGEVKVGQPIMVRYRCVWLSSAMINEALSGLVATR